MRDMRVRNWGPLHQTEVGSSARRAGIIGWHEELTPVEFESFQKNLNLKIAQGTRLAGLDEDTISALTADQESVVMSGASALNQAFNSGR